MWSATLKRFVMEPYSWLPRRSERMPTGATLSSPGDLTESCVWSDRGGAANMDPAPGREVVECEEGVFIFSQALYGLGVPPLGFFKGRHGVLRVGDSYIL